jgi:hypothetical protein
MKKPLRWVPLYIDSWLFGSTRLELNLEQRAIWIDLLALAGKDQGFIRANENMPYPIEQLAGLLRVPTDLLKQTIKRCIETKKLTENPNGTLYVTTWENYKLTPQYIRRLKEEGSKKEENKDKKKLEESKGKGNTVSKKGNSNLLPPIPKGTAFDIKDQLERLGLKIRKNEEILKNGEYLKKRYGEDGKKQLIKETEGMRKEYCYIINKLKEMHKNG